MDVSLGRLQLDVQADGYERTWCIEPIGGRVGDLTVRIAMQASVAAASPHPATFSFPLPANGGSVQLPMFGSPPGATHSR